MAGNWSNQHVAEAWRRNAIVRMAVVVFVCTTSILIAREDVAFAEQPAPVAKFGANTPTSRAWVRSVTTYEKVGQPERKPNDMVSSEVCANGETGVWSVVNVGVGAKGELILSAQIRTPEQGDTARWFIRDNTVYLENDNPGFTRRLAASAASPLSPETEISEFKKITGLEPASVKRTPDGDLEKWEINLTQSEAHSRELAPKYQYWFTPSQVVWINPKTGLVQRKTTVSNGVAMDTRWTYGVKGVADIYDLGAPRDAAVIDKRLPEDLRELINRVAVRADRGLGDGISLLTQTPVKDDGSLDSENAFLHIYARKGDDRAYFQYIIGNDHSKDCANGTCAVQPGTEIKVLAKWPMPDLEATINAVKRRTFAVGLATLTSNHGWLSFDGNVLDIGPGTLWTESVDYSIGARFWPTSARTNIAGNPLIKVASVPAHTVDAAHAGLIGLDAGWVAPSVDAQPGTDDTTRHWFDPTRSDVPVEAIRRQTPIGGSVPSSETITRFGSYVQLASGEWYPTQWTVTSKSTSRPKKEGEAPTTVTSKLEYRLQFFPGKELDASWYAKPMPKVPPATQPAAPAKAGG